MSIEKLFGDLYQDDSGTSRHPTSPILKTQRRRRFRFRLPKVPPKFILFCVLVIGVFYLMHLGYQSIPKKFPLQITSQKPLGKNTVVSYATAEKPQFTVKKPEINPFLASVVRTVTTGSGDGIRVKLVRPDRKEIAFRVNTSLAESGKKKVSFVKKAFAAEAEEGSGDITVTQQEDGVGIGFPALGDLSGQPRGRYVVDVTWEKDGIQYNSDYTFSWGVLVMNTERDRYQTGELVKVGIGMVDDRGHTICEGDVTATITSPTGKKATLKTPRKGTPLRQGSAGQAGKDGMELLTEEQAATLAFVTGGDSSYIATSSECADRSITDTPDYSFQFTVPEKGSYVIDLTATTQNGTERISQRFAVVEENAFVIARSASMRIYPLADYQMRISLLSKNGYTGKVVETVPEAFGITCESCTVTKNGETKLLTWNVSLTPNVPETLAYTYNPPDVSPALFFTGPLMLSDSVIANSDEGGVKQSKIASSTSSPRNDNVSGSDSLRVEQRRWAIAFDAVVPAVNLTQRHYVLEDDDGANVNSNTDIAAADTAITDVKAGERITARFQIDNTSANTFFNPQMELFYDRNDNIWTRVEASGSAAVVPGTGSCTDTNWNCYQVDGQPVSSFGQYSSVAIDNSGKPWISYYSSFALKVASYVGSGGNCSFSTAWSCTTVDSTAGDSGRYTSIDFSASGSAWISYKDVTNSRLKVAFYKGSGGNCTDTAWGCTTVETGGSYTSITFDSSDNAWVSHGSISTSSLRVAKYVGTGGSGCGASVTDWSCDIVDSVSADTGQYTSIEVDQSDNPWVSYRDATNADLKVAQYVGSGGNCTDAAWDCTTVDNTSTFDTSIAFDPSGNAWVSYYDLSNFRLKVAIFVSSSGNCTDAAWDCTVVDETVADVGTYTSIAFDPSGNAWVSYWENTVDKVKVAQYVGSGGNCTDAAWDCGTVDSLRATYTSIAFDPSGNAWVSYQDGATGTLKIARIKRGGEIIPGYGLAGMIGDPLTTNAAGTCTGGASFVTGIWTEGVYLASGSARLGNLASNKCTELSYMIDTSRAVAGTTYRLRLHNASPGYNMGLSAYSQDPTFTVVSAESDIFQASKDDQYALSNCTDTNWGCGTINSNAQFTPMWGGMTMDASGSAWISTFDNWNGDLWVSRYVGANGGGCGAGVTAWKCTKIEHDAVDAVGPGNAIGVDPKGKAWISYYDAVNGDLAVAEYVGSGGTGCGATPAPPDWSCYSVDSTGDTGGYTSIAFDSGGSPWITSWGVGGFLRLTRYVGSGGTGCALTSWTCYFVDTVNASTGRYTTIVFDQTGDPWISYTDQTNGGIRIAQYVGSGGGSARGCGTNSSTEWACETVFDNGNAVGQDGTGNSKNLVMAIDSTNAPWLAFYDLIAGNLWVVKYVGSGGSGCTGATYSTKWSCTIVEQTNDVGRYTSMAIGPDDKPWIGYYDVTNTGLRAAKYVGGGVGTGCGGGSTDWTCTAVDNAGSDGGWSVMAVDASGVPWIAAAETSVAPTTLRIAKLHYPYFDNQIRYSIDDLGYTAFATDDQLFDPMAATTNTPIFRFSSRYGSNGTAPTATWKGKSSVAASTNSILLQAYRFGTTNAWETMTTNSACGANLGCTIIGTPSGTLSEYFDAEGSNYWVHYRTYQVAGTSKTLQTGYFSASLPTKIGFTTGQRAVDSGVCSGASVPFTIAIQDNNGSSQPPTGTTVVQVTSDSSSYTIYSDSSCSSPISGGNITFTTADSSKTFYLVDNVRDTHVLTVTKTSGPDSLTAATQYQITNSAAGDTDSTAITGGVNLRGGSTIR